jgi:hypothetical protein
VQRLVFSLGALVTLAAAAGVAFGSYHLVRSFDDDGGAGAEKPSIDEINELLDADKQKPRIKKQIINGIEIGTEATQDSGYCDRDRAPPKFVDASKLRDSGLDFEAELPPGTITGTVEVVECGGTIVSVFKTFSLPDLRGLDIGRLRFAPNATKSWALYGASDRVKAVEIAGKEGVIEEAVVPGFDATTIVLNEDFGLAVVRGDLTVEEMIKLAESVR